MHRADGTVGGAWRARLARGLPQSYGQRWHAESFISGLKRVLGASLHARGKANQLREALRKVAAYSIRRKPRPVSASFSTEQTHLINRLVLQAFPLSSNEEAQAGRLCHHL